MFILPTKPNQGTHLVYLEVERLVLGPGRKTKARLPTSSKTGKCLGNIGRHLVHFCTFALFQYCNIANLFSMYVCAKHYLKIVPGEMARQTVFPLRSDQRRSWEEITKKIFILSFLLMNPGPPELPTGQGEAENSIEAVKAVQSVSHNLILSHGVNKII